MNFLDEYEAPTLMVLEVDVERGFANSLEDPFENPEYDW